jgi:poly(A) polymerase Pap1
VSKLEISEGIKLAHPFNKGFDEEVVCNNEDDAFRVARGEAPVSSGDTASDEAEEKITVYTTSFYVGLIMENSMRCDVSLSCMRANIVRRFEANRHIVGLPGVLRHLPVLESV